MSPKHKQRLSKATSARSRSPSASTIFRFTILDYETRQEVDRATQLIKPLVWVRDRKSVERIQQAKTAEQVLDLAVEATGMADSAWFERVRQFGSEIVPLMAQRLKASRQITNRTEQTLIREHLIAALRWRGTVGANVLQECFADLDEYAQGLSAAVFGILRARASADLIWDLFQRTKQNRETYFVGALWGLIDLQDRRAADALVDLLERGRDYYEMFGFLARAGDVRAVMPMIVAMVRGTKDVKEQASVVLSAIAHRIGRDALVAEIKTKAPPDQYEMVERTADKLLDYPVSAVEEYFELFYRGL